MVNPFRAPAGGGALDVIQTVELSSEAVIGITLDPDTYFRYEIIGENVQMNVNNNNLFAEASADGGSSFLTGWDYRVIVGGSSVTAVGAKASGDARFTSGALQQNSPFKFRLDITGMDSGQQLEIEGVVGHDDGSVHRSLFTTAILRDTSKINYLELDAFVGAVWQGKVYVLGYKK